jgi:hypothetical protein
MQDPHRIHNTSSKQQIGQTELKNKYYDLYLPGIKLIWF